MKIKKLFLALTIVLIFASPVLAEKWVKVGENSVGTEHFVDKDSIKKAKGFVYYWVIVNYLEPGAGGHLSIKKYIKQDCDPFRYQTLKYDFYDNHMAKGKLILADKLEPKWSLGRFPFPYHYSNYKKLCEWAK